MSTKLAEMQQKLRDKTNRSTAVVTHEASSTSEKFGIQRWYDIVRADRKKINEAAEYFKAAVEDATNHITAIGRLETLVAETPGLAFFYRCIMTDAQQIRRWLEERLEIETAQKHKWLMTSPEAKAEYGELKTTEAAKFAKADETLASIFDDVRLMAYCEHMLDMVAVGFQDRSIMLSHLVNIRKENLQEVWIDPRKETSNN